MKKSGRLRSIVPIEPHAAARLVDAPALPGGVARPGEGDGPPVRRRGAEAPDDRLAGDRRRLQVLELHAIEDVLGGRQAFDQHVGGEVGLREHIEIGGAAAVLEALRGRPVDQEARRPVRPRPHDAGIDRDIAGLHAVADAGAIGGAADERPRNPAGGDGGRGGRQKSTSGQRPADANGHGLLRSNGRQFSPTATTRDDVSMILRRRMAIHGSHTH